MTGAAAPFRHIKALARAPLAPQCKLAGDTPEAQNWNRIGGLLGALCRKAGIPPAAALAVWVVECGGLPHRRGRPVIRFEPHVLFNRWGKDHEPAFDQHFQFGGRNGIEGARWQNHKMRENPQSEWTRFHGDQPTEYRALMLAERLAGREIACQCASFGGPQIMGFNHDVIHYASAREMAEAFARSERWQVIGFFDFCAAKDIVSALRDADWLRFATVYNGSGNAAAYVARIAEAFGRARLLLESSP